MTNAPARDGIRIAYRLTRSRAAEPARVVLVHSLALDATIWDAVVARLVGEAEVVAIDCRGHGCSERPPGPYTIEMFGDDVADVLDHLQWRDAVVAGCSMGGCVAQAFAARHPSRTQGLVLIDTTAWYGPEAPAEWRKRAATARAGGLAAMAGFQTTRWFGDRFREEHPERVKTAMDVFTSNDLECYAATCAMLGDADLRAELPGFRFPVAVVVGEEDHATPIAAAEYLRDSIAGATLKVLPGARHLTPIECPDAICAEIRALIGRTGAGRWQAGA